MRFETEQDDILGSQISNGLESEAENSKGTQSQDINKQTKKKKRPSSSGHQNISHKEQKDIVSWQSNHNSSSNGIHNSDECYGQDIINMHSD